MPGAMIRRRRPGAAACTLFSVLALPVGARAADPGPVVALGDSFTAGTLVLDQAGQPAGLFALGPQPPVARRRRARRAAVSRPQLLGRDHSPEGRRHVAAHAVSHPPRALTSTGGRAQDAVF